MSSSNKGTPAAGQQSQGSSFTNNNSVQQSNVIYADTSALYEEHRIPREILTPHPSAVNMENLANKMEKFIQQYCSLSESEVHAVVLWIVSSYLINSFGIFPKLTLISPEKRCGKTTVLRLILSLSRDGLLLSNVSEASIYRVTEIYQPTLLLDEADTFLKNGNASLTGLVNSGHTKDGSQVLRCDGKTFKAKIFSTWMPMVLASIGDLPSTNMDRSVVINLRRKNDSDLVSKMSNATFDEKRIFREKIGRWCLDNQAAVEVASKSISVPTNLGNDRAADNWLPLFIVASLISDVWERKCHDAYNAIVSISEPELTTQLLQNIKDIFEDRTNPRIGSTELVGILLSDTDKPWSQCVDGRKLTSYYLAQMLKPYGIKPSQMRVSSGTSSRQGYYAYQFDDAFSRYLTQP